MSTDFTFLNQVNFEAALKLLQSSKLSEYRKRLRELWKKALSQSYEEAYPGEKQQLCDGLTKAHLSVTADWPSVRAKLEKEAKDPVGLSYPTIEAKLDWVIPTHGQGLNTSLTMIPTKY